MWEQIDSVFVASSRRLGASIAELVPRLTALLLILLLTAALALLLRLALRRFLRGVNFDRAVANWGFPQLAAWAPQRSATLLVSRAVFWLVLLLGALLGISVLDPGLTSLLVARIFAYVPNLFAALLVFVIGTLAARFLARSVLISAVNLRIHSARLLSVGVKWLIMLVAGAMALEHLGIGGQIVTVSFAILFGGIVLTMALAVGLGSKDMVSRSWEQQERAEDAPEDHLQHL